MHAVLVKLKISACSTPVHLKLAGKVMPNAEPLDISKETHSDCIVLTLASQGLLGGSLSPRDVDDDFKRVSEADSAFNANTA